MRLTAQTIPTCANRSTLEAVRIDRGLQRRPVTGRYPGLEGVMYRDRRRGLYVALGY
jgi:hypothetical protein